MTRLAKLFLLIVFFSGGVAVPDAFCQDTDSSVQDASNATSEGAQDPDDDQGESRNLATHAEESFFDILGNMTQALATAPRFQLDLVNTIQPPGDVDSHQVRLRLMIRQPEADSADSARTQLAIWQEKQADPALLVQCFQGELLREFLPANIYSCKPSTNFREELRECHLTADSLSVVQADFLLQPHLKEHVRHQVVHLSDLGTDETQRHFRLSLVDGREVDLWFQKQGQHLLPIRMESRLRMSGDAEDASQLVTTSEFRWQLDLDSLEWLAVPDPEAMQQVDDLAAALMGRDTRSLIGQPIPELSLTDLEGQPVDLAKFIAEDKQPVLLYFWAVWAAPSVRDLAGVVAFAEELEQMGIRLRPINVADSLEQITEFQKANQLELSFWRDPEGSASQTLGLTTLPSVVLLDGDGNLVLKIEEAQESDRPEIRKAVEALLNASSGQ